MRITFLITLLISLALGLVYPACEYAPSFEVLDVGMSSLFAQPGDTLTAHFIIQSNETFSGEIEAYAERDGFEFPLSTAQEHLAPGQNTVTRSFTLGEMAGPGLYGLHLRAYGFDYSTMLVIEGETPENGLSSREASGKLFVSVPSNESVLLSYTVTSANGAAQKYQRTVAPVNGTVEDSVELCSNCKILIESPFGGGMRFSRTYGAYSEPYVRITGFTGDRLTLESCAPTEYEIYVNGLPSGTGQGIARIENELSTGYDMLEIRLASSNWEFTLPVDLSKIPSETEEALDIVKQTPFTVRITAYDSFGRPAHSEGRLVISGENSTGYSELVSFTGEHEIKLNLPEGQYTVSYNGMQKSGTSVPQEFTAPESQPQQDQFVSRDLVPALIVVLAAAVAVLVLVWVKRMKVRK